MLAKTILLFALITQASSPPFGIQVIDEKTGRGVPMVELKTVNGITYVTDSNGWVAFDEPGLMNQTVYFGVTSHGYERQRDGFGFAGVRLETKAGDTAQIKINRINIAERLYRMTGQGIYRDTILLAKQPPTREPVINGSVLGSDSVVNAQFGGKLRWFWGDTSRAAYPLGNFNVPGAVSMMPSEGGLDPEVGVDLTYFIDAKGFAKETARMPGQGPTWIWGLVVLNEQSKERLFAGYAKIKPPMETYERGICEWNETTSQFDKVKVLPIQGSLHPTGHAFKYARPGEKEYVYFCDPFPLLRVPASVDSLLDHKKYESFSCLQAGNGKAEPKVDRDAAGKINVAWKPDTAMPDLRDKNNSVAKQLAKEEFLVRITDPDTAKEVLPHAGSTFWNPYRQRWVAIFCEIYGTSMLGETWYTEGDTPVGPWVYARKIVSHDKYSFYNPKQHPYFAKDNGRVLFFEGTYTHTFSGSTIPTPRYDYNQMMYKLDLDDARVRLPVPIYRTGVKERPFASATQLKEGDRGELAFFAFDRPFPDCVAVSVSKETNRLLIGNVEPGQTALFFALPASVKPGPTAVPLMETDSGAIHTNAAQGTKAGGGKLLCHVWKNPMPKLEFFNAEFVRGWRPAN